MDNQNANPQAKDKVILDIPEPIEKEKANPGSNDKVSLPEEEKPKPFGPIKEEDVKVVKDTE